MRFSAVADILILMRTTVEAIYEDGVLRPLRALDLPERCPVRLVVETEADAQQAQSRIERAEWLAQSERSLGTVWNNPEDDVYNDLLTQ